MNFTRKDKTMRVYILICLSLLAAPMVAAQVVYDSVRVKVASGTTCPSGWSASTESVTTEDRYILQVPASIGGRAFYISVAFVNLIWPRAATKAGSSTKTGLLVIQARLTVSTISYCSLLP